MNKSAPQRTIGRWTLIGLFALFFGPLLLAVAWYQFAPGFAPPANPNGTLIDPARPLEPFRLTLADGDAFGVEDLRGRWHLVQFAGERCDDACRQRLYDTRQVRRALGKDQGRVRRLLVAADGARTAGLREVLDRHPDLRVASGGAGAFARQFPADRPAGTVFLVDPHGNLMMRFDTSVSASDMLDDIEKLLKLSQIG